ncbi:MAG: phage baseplate upper protein [Ligilactobacillus agilis]|nr:phage baseplate upper protein [Ligilactobacillus agilis]
MQTLKYVIGKDYRPLTVLEAKGGNTFSPDYDKSNWVQARQYEDSLRQVFVEITNEDGSAYDLTGANVLFEGILPDNEHKILDNSHVVFYEDPTAGKFRFDMPAQAFSVAGQYKQAFFRVMKNYRNIATLEFKFEVLADMVVSGLVPRDYISPLDELFNTIKETETKNVANLKKIVDEKINEITDLMTTLNQTNSATLSELNTTKTALEALEDKIKQDGLFTQGEAEKFKNSVLEQIQNSLNHFEYQGLRQSSLKNDVPGVIKKLKAFADDLDQTKTNILFLPDIHYTGNLDEPDLRYKNAGPAVIQMVKNMNVFDGKVDAVFVDGDQIHGNENFSVASDGNLGKWRNVEVAETIWSAFPSTDVYFNEGNHENGSVWTLDKSIVISQEELYEIYGVDESRFGETRDGFFAYKDYPSKKTRLITVNMYENPTSFDSNGKLLHPSSVQSILTSTQLNNLANALESVPDGFKVLIQMHSAPQGYRINPSTKKMGTDNTGLWQEAYINHDVLNAILSAYANKRNVSVTGSNNEFPVSVSANYTNASGKLVGIVTGHYHYDDIDTKDGVNLWSRICFIPENRMVVSQNDETLKDQSNRYAFDVITLDDTTITFNRFHVGADDTTKFTGAGRTVSYEY